MKLLCFFLGHKWSSWEYVRAIGRYDEKLKRTCKRCQKFQNYVGLTDYNHKGQKIPLNYDRD